MKAPFRSSPVPAGLLGMIVLVGVVERFVVRHDLDFSNPIVANWRNAEESARRVRTGGEVLCFGSSMTNHGLIPSVIESEVGMRARNLAVFGGTMPVAYYLVKHALESGPRPEAIVLDCVYTAVEDEGQPASDELRVHIRQWPEVLTLAETLELAWTARDAGFLAAMATSWALPSARARFELRENVRAALAGGSGSSFFSIAFARRNWRINGGAHVTPATGPRPKAERLRLPPRGRHGRWAADRLSETYTRRLLELASRRGIPVVWVFPPTGPRLTAWRDETGLSAHATAFAREVSAEFPGVTFVDARSSGYPEPAFSDELHLNRRGAVSFSVGLAAIIARCASATAPPAGWLTLPPYRDHGGHEGIEDLDQSRLAVLNAVSRPRPGARR